MSEKYNCYVSVMNGFPANLENFSFSHTWTDESSPGPSIAMENLTAHSLSPRILIKSGTSGSDKWSCSFTVEGQKYSVNEKVCNLNSLDKDASFVFMVQYKDSANPVLYLVMNSVPCKSTFDKK